MPGLVVGGQGGSTTTIIIIIDIIIIIIFTITIIITITIINIIIFFLGLIVGGQGGPGEEDSWGASQASWNLSTHPSSSSSRSSSPPSSWIISNILSMQAFLLHPQACLCMPLLKQPQCCSSDSLGAQVNRISIIKNQPNYKQTNAQCCP